MAIQHLKFPEVIAMGSLWSLVISFCIAIQLGCGSAKNGSHYIYSNINIICYLILPKHTKKTIKNTCGGKQKSYCYIFVRDVKHFPQVSFSQSWLLRSSGSRRHEFVGGLAKIFCKALVATSSWDTCDRMDGVPPWKLTYPYISPANQLLQSDLLIPQMEVT